MNINLNQFLAIALVLLGVVTAGTAQLDVLIGPVATKALVALSSLLTSAIGGILGVLTGQSGMVKSVQAMPGGESIVVNKQANPVLAAMAVDQTQAKVEIKPEDKSVVEQTAKGA